MGERRQRLDVDPSRDTQAFPLLVDSDPDKEFDEFTAWLDQEVAAGRDPFPAERIPEPQGIAVGLGDTCGIAPELLAALSGLSGDGGELGPCFGQDAAADVLPP